MKKFKFILIIVVFATLFTFTLHTALASRGGGNTCISNGTPNDVTNFPYGFICGSDKANYPPAHILPNDTDYNDPNPA